MTRIQAGLAERNRTDPKPGTGYMPLMYGYLIGVNKTARTVDVALRGGGKVFGASVVMTVGALPDIVNTTGEPSGKDIGCVVGYLAGDARKAVVLGLILPKAYESSSDEWLITHPTGLTVVIKSDGTIVITRANGTSFELLSHVHSDPGGGTTGAPQ